MNKFIPLSVPYFSGNEKKYIMDAIDTEWVSTAGPHITQFEESISRYLGIDNAVACQSGTAGIHLALMVCGVQSGDEVIVPALTFIASVNPIKYCNAEPVFMDCDDTLNMDLDKLELFCKTECKLTQAGLMNKTSGRIIKAIMAVHVFGNMINMERLIDIAAKYQLKVIEDATEALGTYCTIGKYSGKFAGTIGDFGVYSFNGNKIITTGGGGMMVSNDASKLKRAKYLSTQAKDDELYFLHNEIGYNYRMTNLQAALGLAQLELLEKYIQIKKENFEYYKIGIDKIDGLELLDFNTGTRPNYWFYSLVIDEKRYGLGRDCLIKKLTEKNIQVRPIWDLITKQKPYINNQRYYIEKAFYYLSHIINLPCSTNLSKDDVLYITEFIQVTNNEVKYEY